MSDVLSTVTLDMQDRVDELQQTQSDLQDRREEIIEQAHDAEGRGDDIQHLEDEFDRIEAELSQAHGQIEKFKTAINSWGGSQFTVSELTFGQLQAVSDDMMEKSFDVDAERGEMSGTPKQGFYQIALLRKAIQSTPPNAPATTESRRRGSIDRPAPEDYPIPVSEWLFERVDALNTRGETDMGNTSLQEAMKHNDSGQN